MHCIEVFGTKIAVEVYRFLIAIGHGLRVFSYTTYS